MKHLTLFELTDTISNLVDDIVDAQMAGDTDEVDALFSELDNLYEARDAKHEGYVHVIKNADASAKNCQAEAELFSKRATALKNLSGRLKETLRADMEMHGENATTAGRFKIARQNGPARVVVLIDPTELPTDYQRVTVDPDKSALKDALKTGDVIEGVELEPTEHIRIRVK